MVNVVRLVILLFLMAGCGLKGPLIVPQSDTHSSKEQKK